MNHLQYTTLPWAPAGFHLAPIKDDPQDSGRRLYVLGYYEDYEDSDGQKKSRPVIGDVELQPYKTVRLVHGIAVQAAPGHETQIRARSSAMVKLDVAVAPGTIDNGYVGELASVVKWMPELRPMDVAEAIGEAAHWAGCGGTDASDERAGIYRTLAGIFKELGPLAGLPTEPLVLPFGSRVTQLVHAPVVLDDELVYRTSLDVTTRGAAGFGSTGR